jgi:hypothetical protein
MEEIDVMHWLGWPNSFFVPEDSFEIMMWDYTDGLAAAGALTAIEREVGMPRQPDIFWDQFTKASFGEVVHGLCAVEQRGRVHDRGTAAPDEIKRRGAK